MPDGLSRCRIKKTPRHTLTTDKIGDLVSFNTVRPFSGGGLTGTPFYIIVALLSWLSLGWVVHHRWTGTIRRVGVLVMALLPMSIFVLLWSHPPWIRACMAIIMFLFLGKTWEIGTGLLSPSARLNEPIDFLIWSLASPEGHRVDSTEERTAVRCAARTQIIRGIVKGAAFIGLLYLNQSVSLDQVPGLITVWMGFIVYIMFSGLVDIIAGIEGLLGIVVHPMFNAPPIARNPRDFWGRRWNLWFTKTAHRLIFNPLGGRRRPWIAVTAVFIVSAWLHEVISMLSLKVFDGRMLVFFAIHGMATLMFTVFDRYQPEPFPRPVAIVMHFAWMATTLPWFMGPADDMMGISEWTLESAIEFML